MGEEPPYTPIQFAVALRAGRLLRGLTLTQLAAGTGVPTWRLSSFERGIAKPAPEEFAAVWSFLSSDPPPHPPREAA